MHTEGFMRLLDEMSSRYDRVILDSPPVNVVTDATILSQITDGTILVIKASKTTKDAARRAARQLLDINANLLGVVLNDLDLSDEGYYRQQKYYYYYRGYEYSEKEKEAKA
jgi:Mrp family chromosome partitioning ATPase